MAIKLSKSVHLTAFFAPCMQNIWTLLFVRKIKVRSLTSKRGRYVPFYGQAISWITRILSLDLKLKSLKLKQTFSTLNNLIINT